MRNEYKTISNKMWHLQQNVKSVIVRAFHHFAVLYATVDVGNESFKFYLPAYPMGMLKQANNKLPLSTLPQQTIVMKSWHNTRGNYN